MRHSLTCERRTCPGVVRKAFRLPDIDLDPAAIRIAMISECAPGSPKDSFYAEGDPLFARTTLQAFRDAGEEVERIEDILGLGVYLTTAVKCGKAGPSLAADAISSCSVLLEQELALFPSLSILLLMGDAAIHAVNCIARRRGQKRAIPAGSTYRVRGGNFTLDGLRLFPSYLQAGPAFFIEKTKRRMIAEDIRSALSLSRAGS